MSIVASSIESGHGMGRGRLKVKRQVAALASAVVAVFFVSSGLLKLVSLREFEEKLTEWTLVPEWLVQPTVVMLPVIEIVLGAAFLLGLWPRRVAAGLVTLLTLFTIVYTAHLVIGAYPTCGCLGAVEIFESQNHQAVFVLVRNPIMAATLLLYLAWAPTKAGG